MKGNAMQYYHGVVHKDVDSAFGVSFPDLKGCFSAADDLESVVR
jgi:predicted RNase H-like HicB family nuclease